MQAYRIISIEKEDKSTFKVEDFDYLFKQVGVSLQGGLLVLEQREIDRMKQLLDKMTLEGEPFYNREERNRYRDILTKMKSQLNEDGYVEYDYC
jgi:transcription antitermination factor NusG